MSTITAVRKPFPESYRKTAVLVGVLFLLATATFAAGSSFITSYFTGAGGQTSTLLAGVLLEAISAVAVAGIGVAMWPILKGYNVGLAHGYRALRIGEGLMIDQCPNFPVTECFDLVGTHTYQQVGTFQTTICVAKVTSGAITEDCGSATVHVVNLTAIHKTYNDNARKAFALQNASSRFADLSDLHHAENAMIDARLAAERAGAAAYILASRGQVPDRDVRFWRDFAAMAAAQAQWIAKLRDSAALRDEVEAPFVHAVLFEAVCFFSVVGDVICPLVDALELVTTNLPAPAPVIKQFAPASGTPGTDVRILAVAGVDSEPLQVNFDGQPASFEVTTRALVYYEIAATVPPSASTGPIGIKVQKGLSTYIGYSTQLFVVN
jgi:hypothetical protein